MKKHIFIIGSKGIPSRYGGFETFVEKLTEYKNNDSIQYYVACMNAEQSLYKHNDANCFNIDVPNIGPAKAIYYDLAALNWSINYIKKNRIKDAVIYILACRIGPFMGYYKSRMRKLGISLYVNPDGHEWLRAKWNWVIKKYWKLSEKLMIKSADMVICDSVNIQNYIQNSYSTYKPKSIFISYGAEVTESEMPDTNIELQQWYKKNNLKPQDYYLVVGRFVPENNYAAMIREFMKSTTKKDLVLITNVEKNKFYNQLKQDTKFDQDPRIKFVGTVYDQELLKKIREDAYGYLHGHEVGGTNPSLLEALGSTQVNLLLDVGFNREVGGNAALYWTKQDGNLASLITRLETIDQAEINKMKKMARERVMENYNWPLIVEKYENLFYKRGN